MTIPNKTAIVLVGPTASGKTALSIELAKQVGGEIVSADSRQVYRLLSIGTAKPSKEEQHQAVHHMIDLFDPDEPCSAGIYANRALEIIAGIFSRNRVPIITGGSGMYIRALVDGIFPGKYKDSAIRSQLQKDARTRGASFLYEELQKSDPSTAARIHPNDLFRIVRALEVFKLTGRPISAIRQEETRKSSFHSVFFGLNWKRPVLYQRIDQRVYKMFADGLVEEVRKILEKGYDPKLNSLDTLGYKEVIQYLNGSLDEEAMIALIQKNTRNFAKRQLTWFRRDQRIHWFELEEPVVWKAIATEIAESFSE